MVLLADQDRNRGTGRSSTRERRLSRLSAEKPAWSVPVSRRRSQLFTAILRMRTTTDWATPRVVRHAHGAGPDPGRRLQPAAAVAEVDGEPDALSLLDDMDLDRYHLYHATRPSSSANG